MSKKYWIMTTSKRSNRVAQRFWRSQSVLRHCHGRHGGTLGNQPEQMSEPTRQDFARFAWRIKMYHRGLMQHCLSERAQDRCLRPG